MRREIHCLLIYASECFLKLVLYIYLYAENSERYSVVVHDLYQYGECDSILELEIMKLLDYSCALFVQPEIWFRNCVKCQL